MTYRKIAELAGVSPSTVSKVFSGSTEISRETADRIRQIAKEHGYTPARYYRGGMQNLHKLRISILVPEIISIYYSRIVTSTIKTLQEYGIHSNIYLTDFSEKEAMSIIYMLADEGLTDGILTLTELEYVEKPLPFPVVQLFNSEKNRYVDSVGYDYKSSFIDMLTHLTALGHQSIGFVGEQNTKPKLSEFHTAAEAMSLSINPSNIYISNRRFEKIGYEAAAYFLGLDTMPTAIIAAYDEIALGMIQTFIKAGVQIPEDISIIGMNNIPSSSYTGIPLTTIHAFSEEANRIAVRILLDKIHNPEKQAIQHVLIQCELILRQTTAEAKKRDNPEDHK